MKRFLVACCLLLVLALCASAVAQEVTIGINLSTTGAMSSLGIPNKNAMMLAPTTLGGVKVKYIFLDDQSDPNIARQNVVRLISQDNIDMLIGPSVTPTTLAIIDTIAEAKVPIVTYGSTSRLIQPMDAKKRWVFKTTPNDDIFCGAMINQMVEETSNLFEVSSGTTATSDTPEVVRPQTPHAQLLRAVESRREAALSLFNLQFESPPTTRKACYLLRVACEFFGMCHVTRYQRTCNTVS